MEFVTLVHIHHNNKAQIGLEYSQSRLINTLIKQLYNLQWSDKHKLYYLANTPTNLQHILDTFHGKVWVNMQKFTGKSGGKEPSILNMSDLRNRPKKKNWKRCPKAYYDQLEMRRYSLQTAKTYVSLFERFLNHYPNRKASELSEKEVQDFLLEKHESNVSNSLLNQYINAIKFYYEVVMGMPNRFYTIKRPKKKKKLPVVLSKAEVNDMLQQAFNLKHKCIIAILYGAGLRRGELQKLELEDIDSKRMLIHVRDAKGGKDRMTLMSNKLLDLLRSYYVNYKPKRLLIEGAMGKTYSGSSICKVIKMAAERVGIKKKVTPHSLRHSFATHLLESGVDLRYIQVLMGHNSSRTTEVYAQVAQKQLQKIESPLECLDLEYT